MTQKEISKLTALTDNIKHLSINDKYELISLFQEIKSVLMPYYEVGSTSEINTVLYILASSIDDLEKNTLNKIDAFNKAKNDPINRLRNIITSKSSSNQ